MACSCDDFTRNHLLRRAVAEAGRGLPGIEPGMPLPAGTGMSRRSFVARSLGLGLAVYGAERVSALALEEGIARAAASDRVLVSVFLDGGIDSLSTLFPAGDSRYYALRPTLALAAESGLAFGEDARLRWHPSAAALATLHGEGKLSVLPAVGYTGPDQSHFTSRHYWEVGATNTGLGTGWLGRYLDRTGSLDNPLQGLSLDNRLQPALATGRVPVASVDGPDRYTFSRGRSTPLESRMLAAVGSLGAAHAKSRDAAMRQAGSIAAQSYRLRGQLAPFGAVSSPVQYPADAAARGRDEGFPRASPGWPPCSAPACPSAAPP